MGTAINILIFCVFLAEVILLALAERRLWGTLFTPLNALSLPFTGILLLTLCLPPSLGFVPFYYPSLLIWMSGLALMAIPSWLLGCYFRKKYGKPTYQFTPVEKEKVLLIGIGLLVLPFVFHLRSMMTTSLDAFGSDEFGENFAVYGFFGHALILLSACSILCFTCIRKGNRLLPIAAIMIIAALAFVNQVKSWVIIPLLAGLWLCLMTQKIHLSLKLILLVFVGGISLFAGSYLVIFILGSGAHYNAHMGEYIGQHALHYLCSGVLGLSEDIRQGILESAAPEKLFAPFINFAHSLTGEEYISPINPNYLLINQITARDDNVRTFFGTIYVNCSPVLYALIVLLWGFVLYLVRIWALRSRSIFIAAMDAWFCALLCMGWFEYYFFHITTFEIPVFLCLMMIGKRMVQSIQQNGNYRIAQL